MSSLTHDYHTCCTFCRGIDCTHKNRCEERLLVSDNQFNAYVKHQRSLKHKLQSKQKCKNKGQTSDLDVPPASASLAFSSPPSVCSETGDGDGDFPPAITHNVGVTFDQVKELLGLFSKSFDSKFSAIDSRIDDNSQGVSNSSFPAPTVVARRNKPTPDRTPLAAYTDILGANLGGPAATEASTDVGFPTQMLFGEVLARIRDLKIKFGYVPDNYLMALCGKVIHSSDYSLYLSGDAILDSVRSFCLRLLDPVSPMLGSSRDSDLVIPFFMFLIGRGESVSSYGSWPFRCAYALGFWVLGVSDSQCRLGVVVWGSFLGSFVFPSCCL